MEIEQLSDSDVARRVYDAAMQGNWLQWEVYYLEHCKRQKLDMIHAQEVVLTRKGYVDVLSRTRNE